MQREAESRERNNYKTGSRRIRKEGDTFFTLTQPSSSNPFIPPLIPQLPPQRNFGLWDLVHLHSTLDMLLQTISSSALNQWGYILTIYSLKSFSHSHHTTSSYPFIIHLIPQLEPKAMRSKETLGTLLSNVFIST